MGAPDIAIQLRMRIVKTSCPAHLIVIYLARVVQTLDSASYPPDESPYSKNKY